MTKHLVTLGRKNILLTGRAMSPSAVKSWDEGKRRKQRERWGKKKTMTERARVQLRASQEAPNAQSLLQHN